MRLCDQRGAPRMSPKAQVDCSKRISTSDCECSAGTLTATGTKPEPHHDPGKTPETSSARFELSTITNFGDAPSGVQFTYCSPAPP